MNKERQKKILIIDDDKFLSGLYIKKFTNEGFEVLSAVDGKKGLEIAKKNFPDIIILDILLPEIDGYEVLLSLKNNLTTKNIPVVLLTNFFQKEDIIKCFKAGARDYLIKSHFMPSEVVEKVKKILI
ncbi:MAG: response regulator [bacterium]